MTQDKKENVRKERIILVLFVILLVTALGITIYTIIQASNECTKQATEQVLRIVVIVGLSIAIGVLITHWLRDKEGTRVDYI